MAFEDIATEIREGIGWVEIDRPDQSNALRPQTMREICEALDAFEDDPAVGAIVIIGRGRHFAAGGDFEFLKGLVGTPPAAVRDQIYEHFQGVTRRLFRSAKPSIAAVSGAAITVGCEIALACDFRIGTASARFDESWLRIGLMPPLGGAMLLPRYVGLGLAKEMILDGRVLKGQEALDAGLLSVIVPDEELRASAQARALALAAHPAGAYRAAKEAIHRGLESTMEKEWAANVMAQSILLSTDDFAARLAARTGG